MVTSDTLPVTGSDRSELNSPVPSEVALAPTTPLQKVAPAAPTAPAVALCSESGSRGNREQPMAKKDGALHKHGFAPTRRNSKEKLILYDTQPRRAAGHNEIEVLENN